MQAAPLSKRPRYDTRDPEGLDHERPEEMMAVVCLDDANGALIFDDSWVKRCSLPPEQDHAFAFDLLVSQHYDEFGKATKANISDWRKVFREGCPQEKSDAAIYSIVGNYYARHKNDRPQMLASDRAKAARLQVVEKNYETIGHGSEYSIHVWRKAFTAAGLGDTSDEKIYGAINSHERKTGKVKKVWHQTPPGFQSRYARKMQKLVAVTT